MTEESNAAPSAVPAQPAEGSETTTGTPEQQTNTGTSETEQGLTEQEKQERHERRRQSRIERWRRRAIEAETRLSMLDKVKAPEPATKDDREPKREDFSSYDEFIEARASYRAERMANEVIEKRLKERDERESKESDAKHSRQIAAKWQDNLERAREKLEDLDDVLEDSDSPITRDMQTAILESDVGPEIAYYLAKNPAEAERISKLSPTRQVVELGKLEDRLSKPASKKPSNAPAPINPVDGTKGGAASSLPSENDDMKTWVKKRNAQLGRKT